MRTDQGVLEALPVLVVAAAAAAAAGRRRRGGCCLALDLVTGGVQVALGIEGHEVPPPPVDVLLPFGVCRALDLCQLLGCSAHGSPIL